MERWYDKTTIVTCAASGIANAIPIVPVENEMNAAAEQNEKSKSLEARKWGRTKNTGTWYVL